MKIYFSGSHSTGKSTLARYVSQRYDLPMISETARMVLSEQELQIDHLRCDLEIADKYQQQVFDRQVLEEKKPPAFVSDRSIVDILAYSAQHSRILSRLMSSAALQSQIDVLKAPDSILFFVRPSKATLRPDGVREILNWDGIISIDAQIKLFYEMFNLRYFQISTESMQERVRLIDAVLSLQ